MSENLLESPFVTVTQRGNIVFIAPTGPSVAEREASVIRDDVLRTLQSLPQPAGWLVIDMSAVEFMSSVGIGMCVDLRASAMRLGAEPVLMGAGRSIMQLLKLVQLDRKFRIVCDDHELQKIVIRKVA